MWHLPQKKYTPEIRARYSPATKIKRVKQTYLSTEVYNKRGS